MKERICFLCKTPLSYEDYVGTNLSIEEFLVYTEIIVKGRICKIRFTKPFKKHELVKLWKSRHIQLFCCHCRRFINKLTTEKEVLWDLLEWADNKKLKILKELGIVSRNDLLKLKEKK